MKRFFILILTLIVLVSGQEPPENDYPKDYFRSPVGGTIRLSGSFGELRSNHFHSGIDIKPQKLGAIGEPLYAIADGYVGRVKVSAWGYGNGLYLKHERGYTSVYGHMNRYSDKIAKWVKEKQYETESFEIDIDTLSADVLPVRKGEIVGYMGTTGYSFGSHLHFEIRDTKTGDPINPLLFGLKVADNIPPKMHQLIVYDLNNKRETLSSKIFQTRKGSNRYYIKGDTISVGSSNVGVGLKVYDHMSGAPNWNGIYTMEMFCDDSLTYRFEVNKLSFEEKRYLNAHIDYKEKVEHKSYFNRCYLLPGNRNSKNYKNLVNNGVIEVNSQKTTKVEIITKDLEGNVSKIKFWLKKEDGQPTPMSTFQYILPHDDESIIQQSELQLHFQPHTFYETLYFRTYYATDKSDDFYSGVHHIHDSNVPVHQPFKISILPTNLPDNLKDKAMIIRCNPGKNIVAQASEWEDDFLTAEVLSFGDYGIMIDTIPPTITANSFKGNMSGSSTFSFKIEDDRAGIDSYEASVDGKWLLMNFDGKKKRLFHRFDGTITKGEHEFKLIVRDVVGNESVYERRFTR